MSREIIVRATGLGVTPCSPLAGGLLTGEYSRADLTPANAGPGESTRKSFNAGLEVDFTAGHLARFDEASSIELGYPHDLLPGCEDWSSGYQSDYSAPVLTR